MFSSHRGVVLAAAAAVLVAVPAGALGQGPASYTASDSATANPDTFRWFVSGTTGTDAAITAGGTVTFSSPTSAVRSHNVDFTDAVKPTCQLSTGGAPSTAPMPAMPAREWSGTCTFSQPGTYHFVCDLHPAMTGTITVAAAPAPSTPPAGTTPAPGTPGGAARGGGDRREPPRHPRPRLADRGSRGHARRGLPARPPAPARQ